MESRRKHVVDANEYKIELKKKLEDLTFITVYRSEDVGGAISIGQLREHYPTVNDYLLDMMKVVAEESGGTMKECLDVYFEFDKSAQDYIKSSLAIKSYLAKYRICADLYFKNYKR